MKYYFFSPKHKSDATSAYASNKTKLDHELIAEIKDLDQLPFEFNLVGLQETQDGLKENYDLSKLDEIWFDFQPNSLAWPLMSSKLKSIIESKLTGREGVEWIQARINGNGDKRDYYIPKFVRKLDVLDEKKTMFVPGTDHIIRPRFDLRKIKDYMLFHKPTSLWQITSSIYVSETLKKAIQKEKIADVNFEKVQVA